MSLNSGEGVVIIIVDAYNVLKQGARDTWVSERERLEFIKQLGSYAKRRSHKLIIVFDGGSDDRPSREYMYGVYVVYSGLDENADAYIKRAIEKHHQSEMLLVSSDRDLAQWADRHKVESLDSLEFYKVLCQTLRKNVAEKDRSGMVLIKTTDSENDELDRLMHEEIGHIAQKIETIERPRVRTNNQASKKEKKMVKKIKKL